MGAHFSGSELRVDRIVSSTAARAWSTARLFQEAFDRQVPLASRRDLYHAGAMDLLAAALEEAHRGDQARVMLVGHNPGMHELAIDLCADGEADAVVRLRAKFPTGALAEFDLPGHPGRGIHPGSRVPSGRLLRFVRPKDLPVARTLRL